VSAFSAERYLSGLELFGMRFGLERMHKLMAALGMPQRRFASIHVVGTNGKTSTTRMVAAILERSGLRTGSYTSPDLGSFAERIEVGGRSLTATDFAVAVERVSQAAELVNRTLDDGESVTQFEALTAVAYHELARRRVDVAVVEAGLGGRLDATNVIPSKVAVLTSVGLEHTRWLGTTLEDIAAEKLAVVRDHGCLVTGRLDADVETVVRRVVAEHHAEHRRAPEDLGIELRVRGAFQRRNFALAATAAAAFRERLSGWGGAGPVDRDGALLDGVERAAAELELPGRLEVVEQSPLVIHDCAHNPPAVAALVEALAEVTAPRPLVGVFAMLADKDAAAMLEMLLPVCRRVVFSSCGSSRSLAAEELAALASALGHEGEVVADPHLALARARELAGEEGAVLVTGSTYLISDLSRSLRAAPVLAPVR